MSSSAAVEAAASPLERLLAAAPVVALFAFGVLVYAWQAWLMRSPFIFTDELELTQLARSIADTGVPARRGEAYWKAPLVAFFVAPAWLIDDTRSAYEVAKYLGVTAMTASVFPAYGLARMLVGRAPALFAATGTIAIPAFMYSMLLLEEPFAYLFATLGFFLVVRALATRRRRALLTATAVCLVAPLVRQQLAVLAVVFALAALVLSWQSGTLARWRADWSRGDLLRAGVLALGAAILANEALSHASQTWQIATRHYKDRIFELGSWAGGALALGLGVVPVLLGLALLVRAPGETRTPQLAAFRATLGAAIAAFAVYAAVKGAYLSTVFATRVVERNLIYLAPLLFVATAVWLERPRVRAWALAAASALTAVLLAVTQIQLDHPYFEAPGFSVLTLLNRKLYASAETLDALMLPLLAVAVAVVVAPSALARFRRARGALLVGVAAVLVVWNVAGQVTASDGAHDSARALTANFPSPPTWIDDITGGATTMYLGQNVTDPTGIWLNEFWNRSLRYVWSLDGTAPGPGWTRTPNLADAEGLLISQQGDTEYVLADAGISVVGRVVAQPQFGVAGKPLRLFEIEYPVRLTSSVAGLYPDGWSGELAAFNQFHTESGRGGRISVVASREGWGGTDVPSRVIARVGPIILDADTSPQLSEVTAEERCELHSSQVCRFDFPTPPPPFRVEVQVTPTFSPHELDPRIGDARQLGAQVSFRFSPRAGTR